MSNSSEEEIAKEYICSDLPDLCVIVVDSTCLERNLNLVFQVMEITSNVIVCVNLLDEAEKKGIEVDLEKLSKLLGVPVVGTIANKTKTLKVLMNAIYSEVTNDIQHEVSSSIFSEEYYSMSDEDKVTYLISKAEEIRKEVCTYFDTKYNSRTRKIDKILTSKKFGIPIMIVFLALIFWITITGANYPSKLLSDLFAFIQDKLLLLFANIHVPEFWTNLIIHGMYQTVTWVVAVMLPPMAIFFPLFTLLEDLGYLPRVAFNLDNYFKKACSTGKQALTMCVGFGCNAAGVIGCRIIDSPREKIIAIVTNAFVPCNGRFPFLITVATIFIGCYFTGILSSVISTLAVVLVILLGIFLTLLISRLLSKTLLKGTPSSFILELPPYRKPQIGKILVRSLLDRTLFVLGRAVVVAAPIGIVIWLFANISIGGASILTYIANFLDPFARLMGLDGYILTAFILGIPANEIVLPIILMCYMSSGTLIDLNDTYAIKEILISNGWTLITGINVMIFTLLHFPCSTTLITVYKETKNLKWTLLSFLLPTLCGIILCLITNGIWNLIF